MSLVSQTCFYHLRRLRSVRQQFCRGITARLVSFGPHFVAFRLLQRCPCWAFCLDPCSVSLLMNAASLLVAGLGPHDHVTDALFKFHCLPIAQHIEYKICLSWCTSRLLVMCQTTSLICSHMPLAIHCPTFSVNFYANV